MLNLFSQSTREIHLPSADLVFYENVFGEQSYSLQETLTNTILWKREEIFMFGKKVFQPRLIAWYGNKECIYKYSNVYHILNEWTKELLDLKMKVESIVNADFNCVLLNYYRNGMDSMSWHSDDEPELGEKPIIASLSFGVTRKFQMKHQTDRTIKNFSIALTHDSLLVMKGSTQKYWQHSVPKSEKIISPRINLTFRKILPKESKNEH